MRMTTGSGSFDDRFSTRVWSNTYSPANIHNQHSQIIPAANFNGYFQADPYHNKTSTGIPRANATLPIRRVHELSTSSTVASNTFNNHNLSNVAGTIAKTGLGDSFDSGQNTLHSTQTRGMPAAEYEQYFDASLGTASGG